MKRLDYLKYALQLGLYRKLSWLISAFSVISEAADKWKEDPYEGRIVQEEYGSFFVNTNKELVKIEDTKPKTPIFGILEEITVDNSWIPNAKEPTESLIGALLANYILLVESFGAKVPYIAKNVSIQAIEKFVIQNRDDGKGTDPTKITLKEYLQMGKGVELLKQTPTLSVYSLTPKNLVAPDGFEAKKKELLRQYEGQLSDPVKLAEYEEKIMDIDKEFMKGDPSYGKLVSGKVHRNARRKLVLTSGAEGGLDGKMVPIKESLAEGVPLTPENFAALVNGSRSGSYFRGVDTVKGGVSSKKATKPLATYAIQDGDCGTTMGLSKNYNKFNLENLVGRVVVGSKKPIENITEASNYLGKIVKVRSPAYCKQGPLFFCSACAGPRLSRFKQGLIIPATDLTAAIMAASMAAMHKNVTTTAEFDLESNVS